MLQAIQQVKARALETGRLDSSPSPDIYYSPPGQLTQCPWPQFYHLYNGENNTAVVSKGVNTGLEQGTVVSTYEMLPVAVLFSSSGILI